MERGLRRLFTPPDKPKYGSFEEWEDWELSSKRRYPVRFFLHWTLPHWCSRLRRMLFTDPLWWIKYRIIPRHRYHVVRTGLPPGYYDKDMLLLHASFDLLKRFVEIENPFEHFDTENSAHREEWNEVRFLYDWWTKARPLRVEPDDDEDDAMLVRLARVRRLMWT